MARCHFRIGVVIFFLVVAIPRPSAAPITFDFEGLSEGAVTTQFLGVTFSNATVLMAGSLLNEFQNPLPSESNLVVDDSGAIPLAFASPVANFGGYFTYSLTTLTRLT